MVPDMVEEGMGTVDRTSEASSFKCLKMRRNESKYDFILFDFFRTWLRVAISALYVYHAYSVRIPVSYVPCMSSVIEPV